MILHVEFEQFSATVKRLLGTKEVYCRKHSGQAVVTAGHPEKSTVVASMVALGQEEVHAKLKDAGFEVFEGEWTDAGESAADRIGERETYIAAIAYSSRERMPGLWLDAYPEAPSNGAVLRAFYDELASNGEIPEVSFEEFVRLANPNVVIVSPGEIQSFLNEKEDC